MKHSFFQPAVLSILPYGWSTWTQSKRLEKKIDGNYTSMLRAILNKSWRQHPTRNQLYAHLPHITKTIQVRRTRHAGHCWRSREELISDALLWTPTYGRAKAGLEHTSSSSVGIRDVALRTCHRRWTIGRSGERVSGITMLAAPHDEDDDIYYSVQLNIPLWTFKFPWKRAQCKWHQRGKLSLRKPKTGQIRILNSFLSYYGYWYESMTPKITGLHQIY